MSDSKKLSRLRNVITENLRVQRDSKPIEYIDVGTTLSDVSALQNHTVFARRGCGKTLLLHHSSRMLSDELVSVYLNCEDFKRHTFPNVLIEILVQLFEEINRNLPGWFGKKKKLRDIVKKITERLIALRSASDRRDEEVRRKSEKESSSKQNVDIGTSLDAFKLQFGARDAQKSRDEIERVYKVHTEKLRELDHWLPELKQQIRQFFELSSGVKAIFLQIDDLYHLRRADQAFVVDYIHRLCKDVPLYFKIATLRHASTLFVDRDGQPIGAQERHDYQPINIDYNFSNFARTREQNWKILSSFADKAELSKSDLQGLFRGQGFSRLVMAGGGVPRDVLSLFLEVLRNVHGEKIGKDDIRILSRNNFERRIEELKQDSKTDEQDALLRGIYVIREFCLTRETNSFLVREQDLQQNDVLRELFYRLMDYRIIHNCASALTHKSRPGTFQAFAIDIGCYAHLRKHKGRFVEIDVSQSDAREKMRSAPIFAPERLKDVSEVPEDVEKALLEEDD